MLVLNLVGLAFLKKQESCRLKAYQCTSGIWTIGWGHTEDVVAGATCTQEQADAWLEKDVETAEHAVLANVEAPLTENQYAALVSFAYNTGGSALKRSTLLKKVNIGEDPAPEFRKWVYSGGKPSPGLQRRREAEIELYHS